MSLAIKKLAMLKLTIENKAMQARMTNCILNEQDLKLRKNAEDLLNKVHSCHCIKESEQVLNKTCIH